FEAHVQGAWPVCCTSMVPGESPGRRLSLHTPPVIRDWLERLCATGARTLLVGGVVRNALAGRMTHDWDVATSLPPRELLQLFPEAGSRDLGLGALHLHALAEEEDVDGNRQL